MCLTSVVHAWVVLLALSRISTGEIYTPGNGQLTGPVPQALGSSALKDVLHSVPGNQTTVAPADASITERAFMETPDGDPSVSKTSTGDDGPITPGPWNWGLSTNGSGKRPTGNTKRHIITDCANIRNGLL